MMRCLSLGLWSPGTPPDAALQRFRSTSPTGLLLLSGLFIFSPLLEGGMTHLAVMSIRLMILLLLGLHLARDLVAGALTYPRLRIGPAVLAFLGLAALSTVLSPYTNQSLQWFVVLLSYAALLYLLVCFLREWEHVATLLAVVVAMGLFEAVWALVQAGWLDASRPSGTFFNPNFLAGYLAAIWTLALSYFCYVPVRRCPWSRLRRDRLTRLTVLGLQIVALSVLLVGIVLTKSRGGFLAALVGTTLVVGVRFGRRGLGVLGLLVLLVLLLPTPLRDRLQAEHAVNPVSYARWQIWQNSVREMMDYPLGIGLGLYQYVAPRYAFPVEGQIARYGNVARTPHSEYLQMGVELGVASLPIFCWGVFVLALEARSVLRRRLRRWQRGVLVGVSGGVAGILVHAAVDSSLHQPALALLVTLYASSIVSALRLTRRAKEPARTIPINSRWIWAGVATTAVVVLAVVVARVGFAWMAFEEGAATAARQDYAKAITHYENAIARDPGKALYHSSLAAAYFRVFAQTGDLVLGQASIQELRLASRLNPLDGRLSALLGHVYLSLGSHRVASESLEKGGQMNPGDWRRLALVAYQRAADLEPFSPYYRFELGRLYLALGDGKKAEASVRRAVEIEPNFLPGRRFLAQLYLDSNRIEGARREYREIIERRERYAEWPKGPVEEQLLKTDVTSLRAVFESVRSHT